MADTVLSVRIDEELKQRFMELAKEKELNNKDLMQMLVAHFDLEQLKAGKIQFSQDIDELQRLTKRIADIYLNMVKRVQLEDLEQKNKENSLIETIKKECDTLHEQLKEAQAQEKELEALKAKYQTKVEEIKKFQEEQQILKDLNTLLQQKNKELETNAVTLESKLSAVDQVFEARDQLKIELEVKESQLERLKFKVELLEQEKNQVQNQHEKKELEIIDKMTDQINLIKRQQQIELQELKLTLQMEYMERVEQLKVEHEEKTTELLKKNEQLQFKLANWKAKD